MIKIIVKFLKYFKASPNFQTHESEVRLIPILCTEKKAALDIGAGNGTYTDLLARYSKHCYAFEPVPSRAEFISSKKNDKVTVYQLALSDTCGYVNLAVPIVDGKKYFGRSTIESKNFSSQYCSENIEVGMNYIDNIEFPEIGFIKLDVEGHELAVLSGGIKLITAFKPSILVEAENIHREDAVQTLRNLLEPLGYQGFFLVKNEVFRISSFDPNVHQNPKDAPLPGTFKNEGYINNFLFIYNDDLIKRLYEFEL